MLTINKRLTALLWAISILFIHQHLQAQQSEEVILTGTRFTYPLLQKWIQDFTLENPSSNLKIIARAETDPKDADITIDGFALTKDKIQTGREYFLLGRYAILPIANAHSDFTQFYQEKGLNREELQSIFFRDLYADKKNKATDLKYQVYTRLQPAPVPETFAKTFGFAQNDIAGKSIAGADEHLITAMLKDPQGVAYSSINLIYDLESRRPKKGLAIIPIDFDENGKVNDDDMFYDNLDLVLERLGKESSGNLPVSNIYLSINKSGAHPDAKKFVQWVLEHGISDLSHYGFLPLEEKQLVQERERYLKLSLN